VGTPETRVSLILRLPNASDAEAWNEFVGLYRPIVFATVRRSGLQADDAEEVTQEVLLAVAGAVARWQPNPERARFRTWLARITHNLLVNFLYHRRRRGWDCGGSDFRELMEQQPDPAAVVEAELVQQEYRRCLFWAAANNIRQRVSESTWQAFYQNAVAGRSPTAVAAELGLSVSAIYVARSRVTAKLKAEVQRLDVLNAAVTPALTESIGESK
jgi:RNA polymerase sigma factor (sigma-70 family)